jgi:hypothetical protein
MLMIRNSGFLHKVKLQQNTYDIHHPPAIPRASQCVSHMEQVRILQMYGEIIFSWTVGFYKINLKTISHFLEFLKLTFSS